MAIDLLFLSFSFHLRLLARYSSAFFTYSSRRMVLYWSRSDLIRKPHVLLKRGVLGGLGLWTRFVIANHLPPCGVLDQSILTCYPLFPAFESEPTCILVVFYWHETSWCFASAPLFVADHTCVLWLNCWCVLFSIYVRLLRRCTLVGLRLLHFLSDDVLFEHRYNFSCLYTSFYIYHAT